jgi:predicted MFS family arabinose efflux permease
LFLAVFFLALSGALGNIYWIPTFVKRLSGFSDRGVTALLIIPALIGIAGMLGNGCHSDKKMERRLHTISLLLLGSGFLYAFLPVFWSMPTAMLSESTAAATLGLINSIGQLGGLAGPYIIGFLNDRTHSLTASFGFIALVYIAAASLILSLRITDPIKASEGSRIMSGSKG